MRDIEGIVLLFGLGYLLSITGVIKKTAGELASGSHSAYSPYTKRYFNRWYRKERAWTYETPRYASQEEPLK